MSDKINTEYYTKSYTIKDFYNSYNRYIEDNDLMPIDFKVFQSILQEYFEYLRDQVIQEGKIMNLLGRFGEISIRKYPSNPKILQYDYKSSKELNKPVWYFNEHTNGYRYKFYWNKSKLLVKNCTKYQMVFTRENKRHLAKILKNNERDYKEL